MRRIKAWLVACACLALCFPAGAASWVEDVLRQQGEARWESFSNYAEKKGFEPNQVGPDVLAPLLEDANSSVRRLAFRLLDPYPPDSLPWLLKGLTDAEQDISEQAFEKLVEAKGRDSVPYLLPLLEQGPPNLEAAAVRVLGRYKQPESLKPLVEGMLRFARRELRDDGQQVPGVTDESWFYDQHERVDAYSWALSAYPAEAVLPLLRPELSAPEPGVKLMVFRILYQLRVPEIEAPLLAWISSAPAGLKPLILQQVLIRRSEGGSAVHGTSSPQIQALLFKWAFSEEDWELQQATRRYLERALERPDLTWSPLEAYLKDPRTRSELIQMLPNSFGEYHPKLLPYFYQALGSGDTDLVSKSLVILTAADVPDLDARIRNLLARHTDSALIPQALWSLSQSPQNQALITSYLHHRDAAVRKAALETLAHFPLQPQKTLLLKLFGQDVDPEIRLKAFALLCELKDEALLQQLLVRALARESQRASKYLETLAAAKLTSPRLLAPFLNLNPELQVRAIGLLPEGNAKASVPLVLPLLRTGTWQVQSAVLELIRRAEPEAGPVKASIRPFLSSGNESVKISALNAWAALVDLPDAERRNAVPRSSLTAANWEIRRQALELMTQDNGFATDLPLFVAQVRQAGDRGVDQVTSLAKLYYAEDPEPLLALLDHPQIRVREEVVHWLAHYTGSSLGPDLLRQMQGFGPDGLASALQLIGLWGWHEQSPLLKSHLSHPEIRVRAAALLGLGLLRDPDTAKAAEAALQNDVRPVQEAGVQALTALHTEAAVPGLLTALASPHDATRQAALWALRKANARQAMPRILALFSQQVVEDRVVGCFGFPERSDAIRLLSDLVDPDTQPGFIQALRPDDLLTRTYHYQFGDYMGNDNTVADNLAERHGTQSLLPFLDDPRPKVRTAIAASLANYPDPAWEPAVRARLSRETDPSVKLALYQSLAVMGARDVVPALLTAFRDPTFKEAQFSLGLLLLDIAPGALRPVLQQMALAQPAEYLPWNLLSHDLYSVNLAWLKSMSQAKDPMLRQQASKTIEAITYARSHPNPRLYGRGEPLKGLEGKKWVLSAALVSKLQSTSAELRRQQGHPAEMLRLAHTFLRAAAAEGLYLNWASEVDLEDQRLIPIWIALLLETDGPDQQDHHHQPVARIALRRLALPADDPRLLALIQSQPPEKALELKLFQVQLLLDHQQIQSAITRLKALLDLPETRSFPATRVRMLHLLSDLSPPDVALDYLQDTPAYIARQFSSHDEEGFSPPANFQTLLRLAPTWIEAGNYAQAQATYRQALETLYTQAREGQIRITPYGAVIQAGLAEAALKLNQPQEAEMHLIQALEFWARYDAFSIRVPFSDTEWLPLRHSPKWAYEQLLKLLRTAGNTRRLDFFSARFKPLIQ